MGFIKGSKETCDQIGIGGLVRLDTFIKAVEEIPAVEAYPRWIPCSERLPERDIDVLAYVIGIGIKYQRVMWIDDCTGEWAGFIGSERQDEVLAWMPLPEPYEEE